MKVEIGSSSIKLRVESVVICMIRGIVAVYDLLYATWVAPANTKVKHLRQKPSFEVLRVLRRIRTAKLNCNGCEPFEQAMQRYHGAVRDTYNTFC